jgi:putative ABC transport system permease protein
MFTPDELKQRGHGMEAVTGRRVRNVLVAIQAALALIAVIEIGLIVHPAWHFRTLELGFDPTQLLTLRIELPLRNYSEPRTAEEFFRETVSRIQALPGAASVAAVTRLPIADREQTFRFTIEGVPLLAQELRPLAAQVAITVDYLPTMRIPVVRGRALTSADFRNSPPVALVNEEAAGRYWPGEDAIGKRVMFDPPAKRDWIQIVGIVGNIRNSNAGSGPLPQIYVPTSWQPERSMAIVVRTAGTEPTQLAPAIRAQIAQVDKDQPIYAVSSMEQVLFNDLGGTYLLAGILTAIGIVVLWMAAAGVYAVSTYAVSQRTREIGLRIALGARRLDILRMILVQGGMPVAMGFCIGSFGASVLAYHTSHAFDEINGSDTTTYIAALVLLMAVALMACYLPARHATKVDPMVALRGE